MRSQFSSDANVPGVQPHYLYLKLSMGKQVEDSPDARATLRQYARAPFDQWQTTGQVNVGDIRNLERRRYQRECASGATTASNGASPLQEFLAENGAAFGNRQQDGMDFRFRAVGNTDLTVNFARVVKTVKL
jgi:hypothetical protein